MYLVTCQAMPPASLSAYLSAQLPRAVNTQALSSAGLLRMVNKAADAVNKMTIKMNESDAVSAGGEEEEARTRRQLARMKKEIFSECGS